MKKMIGGLLLLSLYSGLGQAQTRISKDELKQLSKALQKDSLLVGGDADFKGTDGTTQWPEEGAVILAQKTAFDFDRKGLTVVDRVLRGFKSIIAIPVTLGISLYTYNSGNPAWISVIETERRKILLRDKFAIDQYSILYFRLLEGDAFAARVIKKDGHVRKVNFEDAVRVNDLDAVPDIFRSYTDKKFTAYYQPKYFKLAVSDIEEGDVIEYAYKNDNESYYQRAPKYNEFEPVYYVCNRVMPVQKQVIEIAVDNPKYFMTYRSLKGAPEFVESALGDKKVYRWTDVNRDKRTDVRYASMYRDMPSVKFQLLFVRGGGKKYMLGETPEMRKKGLTNERLLEKARLAWFDPASLKNAGSYTLGIEDGTNRVVSAIYSSLRKKSITQGNDADYVRKAYYMVRAKTMANSWNDYTFAKVFSELLDKKGIEHEIIVGTFNTRSGLDQVAFTQELTWSIRYKNKYYTNPDAYTNPEDVPEYMLGSAVVGFSAKEYDKKAVKVKPEVLPIADTVDNVLLTQVKVSMDTANKANISVEKNVEARGLVKQGLTDVLAYTPFMEYDFKNYDGEGMFEGMKSLEEAKAATEFRQKKKDWDEEKPKVMKAWAESEYNSTVEKYDGFKLVSDGRSYKKRSLQYTERFVLSDMTAFAGEDVLVSLPGLIGEQPRIKKDEYQRTLPVDLRYPRSMRWSIVFTIPMGYKVASISALNQSVDNVCGSFSSTAKIDNGQLVIDVKKVYNGKNYDVQQWQQVMDILDKAYKFSQVKIVLRKA